MRAGNGLVAGHARVEITPDAGCPLIGYDQRAELFPAGGNAGALDALFAGALFLEAGRARVLLVTLDLCVVESGLARELRRAAGEAAGCALENVVLACSHTHSGPFAWGGDGGGAEPLPGILRCEASRRYAAVLESLVARAASEAAADARPAALRHRSSALGLGYIRRVRMPDGGIGMAWSLREWDGPAPEPAADPAFEVLLVERSEGESVVVWSAAAHPVVLGKYSNVVSADWPGAARRMFEAAMPGWRAIFLHGAGGDTHPWLATGKDPADLEAVAAPAAALLRLLVSTPGGARGGEVLKVAEEDGVSVVRLGPSRLLACPFELFGSTGRALRGEWPRLLLATTANGWSGYCPPAEIFKEGGYEVEAALSAGRRPGDCEAFVGRARKLSARAW